MKGFLLFSSLLAPVAFAYPWLASENDARLPEGFAEQAARGLKIMKRDPEIVQVIQTLYAQQQKEKDQFFKNYVQAPLATATGDVSSNEDYLQKRQSTNCLSHPNKDFLPTNITGLTKFPQVRNLTVSAKQESC